MASSKILAHATRAMTLTSSTGIPHLRAQGLLSAAKAALPSVGALPSAAVPLSSASRGGVPILSSMGNFATIQRPACSGLRQFSSSSGGGAKLPAWLNIDNEKPAKMFRQLDYHGQTIIILCNQLIHEKGVEIETSLSSRMKELEKVLLSKIAPDDSTFQLDRFAMDMVKPTCMVIFLGGAWYVYTKCAEDGSRVLEALGQMRIHSAEIVDHFAKAYRDSSVKPNVWPFVKFPFVFQDRWWIDPIKQAERDEKARKKLAKKKEKKEDGGCKK